MQGKIDLLNSPNGIDLSAHHRAVRIIAVYRPPYSEAHPVTANMFFDEFANYLENVVMCPGILVITGDFNFHLDDPTNSDANTFTELLETFGLLQHISLPTHVSGHTLDLLITRSSNDISICSTNVSSLRISDHYFVHGKLSIPRPHLLVEKVKFRKLKQINVEAFKSDLKASDLCTTSWSNLDDMVKCYDETLTGLLESHAPLKTKVIVVRPRVPWFSEELKRVKRKRRKQERKMLKTGNKCDRDTYRCVCNQYSALLKKAKGLYYTDLIDKLINAQVTPRNFSRL